MHEPAAVSKLAARMRGPALRPFIDARESLSHSGCGVAVRSVPGQRDWQYHAPRLAERGRREHGRARSLIDLKGDDGRSAHC